MTTQSSSPVLLTIKAASDADRQEVEELTQSLFDELEHMISVTRVSSRNVPAGSKAIDAAIIGQLALALLHSGRLLAPAIGVIQAWLLRQNARSIVLEFDGNKIEVKGPSSEEQSRLIDAWITQVREKTQHNMS